MSTLFYNFLAEEILITYFKKTPISAGDKYYLLIEDKEACNKLLQAFSQSPYTKRETFLFDDEQGFDSLSVPCEMSVIDASPTPILVSDYINQTDGFQTKIRNSVGVSGSCVENFAVFFILPGSTTIETLLTTGQNLQAKGCPVHKNEIKKVIETRSNSKINDTERAYLKHFYEKICNEDDFNTLLDFAPVLTILQNNTIRNNFFELGFFEDSEIYNSLLPCDNESKRVQDNATAFSTIADIMGEMQADTQKSRLDSYVGKELAERILSDEEEQWKYLKWEEVENAIKTQKEKATLKRPSFDENKNIVIHSIGTDKRSKSYVIVCDPDDSVSHIRCKFNKDLKDIDIKYGNKKHGTRLILSFIGKDLVKEEVSVNKNSHSIIAIKVRSTNIFKQIEKFFTLDAKGNIIIDLPDSIESITLGNGDNVVSYNGIAPIELGSNDKFCLDTEATKEDRIEIPFLFGEKITYCAFKIKSKKTPTLNAKAIINEVLGKGANFSHNGEAGELKGTIEGPAGPIYLQENLRKLVNLEKLMIEQRASYLAYSFDSVQNKEILSPYKIENEYCLTQKLNAIYEYFEERNTVPSLHCMTPELSTLYKSYLEEVNNRIDKIPENQSLSPTTKVLGKFGTVQCTDDSLFLTPFHPLIIAYSVTLAEAINQDDFSNKVIEALSPIQLIPYIYQDRNRVLMAVSTSETEYILNWIKFVSVTDSSFNQSDNNITDLVTGKIKEFIKHFKYYFPDYNCPLILTTIGLSQSIDVVRGIIYYITGQVQKDNEDIQKIELHEYVDDILHETFFEKLNRTSAQDIILEVLKENNIDINEGILNDTLRILFSKLSYYKHLKNGANNITNFSHIVFYKLGRDAIYSPVPSDSLRTETALQGLVSSISSNQDEHVQSYNTESAHQVLLSDITRQKDYLMGFGTNGLKDRKSLLYQTAININSLYAGMYNNGRPAYSKGQCVSKAFSFDDEDFLNSVYNKSTWVTFVNPEVDIDFFYKHENVYVVHYVEQHSISAKLKSITVTKHTKQYNNLVFNATQAYKNKGNSSSDFSKKIINYFNCLNGKWLLELVNKDSLVIREKMSLVATCSLMEQFLKRTEDIVWIPIAQDEIIKATGSIGGKLDGLFSKKSLEIKGPLSDDLIMVGFKRDFNGKVSLYFYPVEVKVLSANNTAHGEEQIVSLYKNALEEVLFKGDSFSRKVYRVLFASLFLTNAEKMKANGIIDDKTFAYINESRYELLNYKFEISDNLPLELGKAALVVYSDATPKSIYTSNIDDVPVCHINMMERDCYSLIDKSNPDIIDFITRSDIPYNYVYSDQEANTSENNIMGTQYELIDDTTSTQTHNLEETTLPPAEITNNTIDNRSTSSSKGIRVELGTNTSNKQSVFYEPNNTNKLTNPNMAILGIMGTGKTQQALSIVAQIAQQSSNNVGLSPVGILIFDYKGDDYSKDKFLNVVKGTAHNSNFPFNPLKLIQSSNKSIKHLPANTADNISNAFATVYNLGPIQKNNIYNVILDVYRDVGITEDPATWKKKVPTMNDVVNKYLETYNANDKAYALLQRFLHFSIFEQNPEDCVSMFEWLDRVRVIDLSGYGGDDTKKIIVSLILDLFYAEMKQLGESVHDDGLRALRAMVLVDEAHHFLGKDFNSLRSIISEGRMFGVGMILSSQRLSDFKSASIDYAEFILSWIIHNVNKITASDICNTLNVDKQEADTYLRYIRNAKKHESLCKLGNSIVGVRDLPFYELLQRMKKESKKN